MREIWSSGAAGGAKVVRIPLTGLIMLGEDGWMPCGNVTIPANHPIPTVGRVIEARYMYAHRESNALYQPVYLGPRSDVDVAECLLTQLKYKPED